jgi:hypothetical protein
MGKEDGPAVANKFMEVNISLGGFGCEVWSWINLAIFRLSVRFLQT